MVAWHWQGGGGGRQLSSCCWWRRRRRSSYSAPLFFPFFGSLWPPVFIFPPPPPLLSCRRRLFFYDITAITTDDGKRGEGERERGKFLDPTSDKMLGGRGRKMMRQARREKGRGVMASYSPCSLDMSFSFFSVRLPSLFRDHHLFSFSWHSHHACLSASSQLSLFSTSTHMSWRMNSLASSLMSSQ